MTTINSIPLNEARVANRAKQEKQVVSMTAAQRAKQIVRERARARAQQVRSAK